MQQIVCELEITAPKKRDTYNIGTQTDPQKLGRIQEDEEYDDEDDFDARFRGMMNTGRGRADSAARRDSIKTGVTEVVKKPEAKKPVMEE